MIDHITNHKTPWEKLKEEEREKFNVFYTHKLLSSNEDLIELVNYIQSFYTLPKREVYNLYLKLIPQGSYRFYYPQKTKKQK